MQVIRKQMTGDFAEYFPWEMKWSEIHKIVHLKENLKLKILLDIDNHEQGILKCCLY